MDADLGDPGGVGQQVAQVAGREAGLGRDELVGAQVVVGGRVEVDQALLPQLHDRDRREELRDRADPEDRVLGDRARSTRCRPARVRGTTRAAVADDADRQADRGPAARISSTARPDPDGAPPGRRCSLPMPPGGLAARIDPKSTWSSRPPPSGDGEDHGARKGPTRTSGQPRTRSADRGLQSVLSVASRPTETSAVRHQPRTGPPALVSGCPPTPNDVGGIWSWR